MKTSYRLVLFYVDWKGTPKYHIEQKQRGVFWGETWSRVSTDAMALQIAQDALTELRRYESNLNRDNHAVP